MLAARARQAAPLALALALSWARNAESQPTTPPIALTCAVNESAITCKPEARQEEALKIGNFSASVSAPACDDATLSIALADTSGADAGTHVCKSGQGTRGAIKFPACSYIPGPNPASTPASLRRASYKCSAPTGQLAASSNMDVKLGGTGGAGGTSAGSTGSTGGAGAGAGGAGGAGTGAAGGAGAAGTTSDAPRAATAGDAYELTRGVRDSVVRQTFGLNPAKTSDRGAAQDRARTGYYNRSGDAAVLFFNTSGEPLVPLPDVLDENDDIHVAVIDFDDKFDNFSLSLEGCERAPVEPRVYLAGGSPFKTTSAGEKPIAGVYRSFGKCAGGGDGPRLVFRKGRGNAATTSSFAVHVNPLYRFSVGVALAFDATRVRSFDLQRAPGDTVPRVAQSKDALGLSSLVYVSLYLSPRDFRKRDTLLLERTQLFVGLDPRALDEHLVVGAGYELTVGLNALLGWRVLTRQKVLADGSGLRVGDTFEGPEPPTRERWEVGGPFVGVGLSPDLLARFR